MIASAALILAALADVLTTRYGVTHGLREANPIYAGNPTWAKLAITHGAVVAWCVAEASAGTRAGLAAVFALAAGWNAVQIRRSRNKSKGS